MASPPKMAQTGNDATKHLAKRGFNKPDLNEHLYFHYIFRLIDGYDSEYGVAYLIELKSFNVNQRLD